jgi:hypothetical protein
MPYTPPAGNATNFQFGGAYTPRDGDRTNFSFEAAGVLRTDGWLTTKLGTPFSPIATTGFLVTRFGAATARMYGLPSGFLTGQIGSPRLGVDAAVGAYTPTTTFGAATLLPISIGFSGTQFGTPNSPYLQVGDAAGFSSTVLSTPRLTTNSFTFGATPSTTISPAYTATAQTADAVGVARTRFGLPLYRVVPDITDNVRGYAFSWTATLFGTPAAPSTSAGVAQGFSSTGAGWPRATTQSETTEFGTPRARFTTLAAGWVAGSFGSPTALYHAASIGRTPVFGAAAAQSNHLATGYARPTRLGVPASILGGHKAYGFYVGARLGAPGGWSRFNRVPDGWSASLMGTPLATERHRSAAIPPVSTFGTALLVRNPTC